MPMRKLLLLFISVSWPYCSQADHVSYELGSYRNKSLLTYSENSIEISAMRSGRKTVLCSRAISEDTLSHSLEFFKETGIPSWEPTYFSEGQMDGITFKLSAEIYGEHISSMGHLTNAPKEHRQLIRYFNQLLVVNGCEKSI